MGLPRYDGRLRHRSARCAEERVVRRAHHGHSHARHERPRVAARGEEAGRVDRSRHDDGLSDDRLGGAGPQGRRLRLSLQAADPRRAPSPDVPDDGAQVPARRDPHAARPAGRGADRQRADRHLGADGARQGDHRQGRGDRLAGTHRGRERHGQGAGGGGHSSAVLARREDIPSLINHFLRRFNKRFHRDVRGVAPEALAALSAYTFPGNVRELENLIERAFAMGAREQIALNDLPSLSKTPMASTPVTSPESVPALADVERELILKALAVFKDDKEAAAKALGISRRTIYRRLKEYGVL